MKKLLLSAPLALFAVACTSTPTTTAQTASGAPLAVTADPTPVNGAEAVAGVPGNKYDDKDGGTPVTTDNNVIYRAVGTDPYWTLNFGDKLTFTNHDTGAIVVERAPKPKLGKSSATYRTSRMKVTVMTKTCVDKRSGNTYTGTTMATIDGVTLNGCSDRLAVFLAPSRNNDPGDLDVDGVKVVK